ncbi:DUF3375 family protein [Nocardioides abyssi]|uniref:DUF3375 family protein n=1 Tax=Nocardioides abyssi TaxID=3058370 RepID=A0ABT8ESF0_9ACTN|nr:DUF3375 family protein [Nocardioides abyssi]MDN4161077.1 DUF3375 family protein [Nocardioides abyssi]
MSNVVAEHGRACDVLARAALRMLDGKWAAFRIAVFRSSFSRERRSVAADLLHQQVDTYMAELVRDGKDVPPSTNGRGLCNQWVDDEWLFRDSTEDGTVFYSLTSGALEALDWVQEMARDRVLVSESRLQTILNEVRRWALEASPDASSRIERLNAEIREREAERDRLAAGGEVATASVDKMLGAYTNLLDLISQLPSDFKRVEEAMLDLHRKFLTDFRNDDRPGLGQMLDDFLARYDRLVMDTPEGRAFDSAFVLLSDEVLLSELQDNLRVILEHPAAEVLDNTDVREIRGAEPALRQGTADVLAQLRRVNETFGEQIVNRNVLEERELDRVLRGIERELADWMEHTGPRTTVPLGLLPPTLKVGHLRERTWDLSTVAPPPPLSREPQEPVTPPTAEELRAMGGPALDDLRAAVVDAFLLGDMDTVGELFNTLPDELRRPVEILGLLHVVSRTGAFDPFAEAEVFEAIRPNGERRNFLVPAATLTPDQAAALDDDTRTLEGTDDE